MKHKSSIWLPVLFLLTHSFISCQKESSDLESEIEAEETAVIIDPFYSVLTEASTLQEYWDLFVADAIRSGKADPGTGRNVSIFFWD